MPTREQVTSTAAQITYVYDGHRYCVWVMTQRAIDPMTTQATPTDPLDAPQGFTYTSTCTHCGQPVQRVVGESHWTHINSQVTRCHVL
jgi:hypothetical protein